MSYDYIVFESYYKHGETMTNIYDSLYDFFEKELYYNMENCLCKIKDHNESENERSKKSASYYYNKYKYLLSRRPYGEKIDKIRYFTLLTEEIESDEDKLFEEVIDMNEYIIDIHWSIRGIVKVKKDSYSISYKW